jgi:hypothetical protein
MIHGYVRILFGVWLEIGSVPHPKITLLGLPLTQRSLLQILEATLAEIKSASCKFLTLVGGTAANGATSKLPAVAVIDELSSSWVESRVAAELLSSVWNCYLLELLSPEANSALHYLLSREVQMWRLP